MCRKSNRLLNVLFFHSQALAEAEKLVGGCESNKYCVGNAELCGSAKRFSDQHSEDFSDARLTTEQYISQRIFELQQLFTSN